MMHMSLIKVRCTSIYVNIKYLHLKNMLKLTKIEIYRCWTYAFRFWDDGVVRVRTLLGFPVLELYMQL
jgi:hypothetical protein